MDIFRRQKFDEAMFAKNRTLAIRVGQYQSSNIKEAHFDYGYIKGDTYKPGGTCAGSGKITFTSIITSFNKLDKVYPEIGLLVDGTYEWVKMGEYFINDIEIDRNRNTTTLDLMDGMFKLNREHITDLTYPAEIRQVIKEICLKTGIVLANENMDLTSMNYVIDKIPKEKKMTFRDILSLATQMLGMSCFFNREGKLEIKELTDSGITITADSYFMHGLTKSEVQYQIAGITCKKEKETLTVGMRTGRSLELDNLFMSQSILDNLYHKIKDIRYYPFNLNYQGHLLLDVGQWVTIKTNKGETFKSPVLSQSFTFKGGLRGRISADSKSGNDAQYSYAGTFTKKIEQFSEFEKQIQNQIEEADQGFDKKVEKIKKDFNDQIELAKAKAEEMQRQLSETIDQRFRDFDSTGLNEIKQKADEALQKVGANTLLAQEAKQISEQATADITKLKNEVVDGYVGKNTYREGIRGIERRIEEVKTSTDGQIATQIAEYKQTVDGQFTNLVSQIENKANQTDFQRVKETSQLYERILGNTENGIAEKVARMTLTNQLFQVEVSKATKGGRNYIRGIKEMSVASGSWDSGTFRSSGSGSIRTIDVLDSPVPDLNKAVRIVSNDPKGSIGIAQDGFKILPGVYTMSVWVKGSPGQRVRLQNYWEPDDPTGISPEFILKNDKWTFLTFSSERKKTGKLSIGYVYLLNSGKGSYIDVLAPQLEEGSLATSTRPAIEDTDEAVRTVQNQLAGSWGVHNKNSVNEIIAGFNLAGRNAGIKAETIRLEGRTLLDELTAIQGYFKRLFVGEGNFAKLNAEIIGSKTITADKLIMDSAMARMFVSSDIFTDTLAAKEAFIKKIRSVVVTATLLEGYKGRIGGFQIGTHDKDPSSYWITGKNQFYVGMSNGAGSWNQTALWVNWGSSWDKNGDRAWFVKNNGQMFCYNTAEFWNTPVIHGNLKVTGKVFYDNGKNARGEWIYSPYYSHIDKSGGSLYLYKPDTTYDWILLNKDVSDRRYKKNIADSTVSGLDVIQKLKTYSYRKEYGGKIEDIACGIMAQDVQKYVPEAFFENPDGAYSYRTFELVPYLIKAIQELNQKIEKMEKIA
ncbi:tail fiber domain-containing protein [Streptococcus pseudopneumoniae]|uniref:tail fiber domain-containing protein n=1 Tax=Streptococcus pseudopneumoniae TaxID=257758 RepID=UPI000ADE9D17|nr:tail fiber domain-containing protein [Streptococcus pseudopneumoniae]